MSGKWTMSLEWFDKCRSEDFKNGATISAIRDVIKERDSLRHQLAAAREEEKSMRAMAKTYSEILDRVSDVVCPGRNGFTSSIAVLRWLQALAGDGGTK